MELLSTKPEKKVLCNMCFVYLLSCVNHNVLKFPERFDPKEKYFQPHVFLLISLTGNGMGKGLLCKVAEVRMFLLTTKAQFPRKC